MNNEDFKIIFFDSEGNIHYNIEYEFNDLDFLNIMYGTYKDMQFICISDNKLYNQLTKMGRKKSFNVVDQIFIEHYINCKAASSIMFRIKKKIKEFWKIFYTTVIKNKQIYFMKDVDEAEKQGIKYGLEHHKRFSILH